MKVFPVLAPIVQAIVLAISCVVFSSSSHPVASETLALAVIIVGFACGAADVALLRSALEAADAELSEGRARAALEQVKGQRLRVAWAEREVFRADSVRSQIAADLREAREGMDRDDACGTEGGLRSAEGRMSSRGPICEHLEANVLLELKRLECEEAGVRCSFDVRLPSDVGVPALDVCALFSNMIDNALAAASCAQGDARFVEVKVRCDLGLLIVSVRNGLAEGAASGEAACSPVRCVDGHGWGTGILKDLAKRYNGSFETERRDGVWLATAVLELPR